MRFATLLVTGFLGGMIMAVPAARAEHVVDRAKFFSADAIKQAEDAILELERKHQLDVRVETYQTVPDDQVERVKGMSAKERGEFFARWLRNLAQESKAKGLFILVCREPSHLRIGVGKELHARGFSDTERDAATDKLIAAFKEKEYDRGLKDALDSIRASADRKLRAAAAMPGKTPNEPPASAFPAWAGWLCLGIGGLVAIGAILLVVSSLFRGTGGAAAPGGYGGGFGGGGGILGGLLSGFGGALLGNWMYDQWSGRSAHAGEPDSGTPDHAAGSHDDNYQDFSSSGGDFGDSGGGDFGGGDFGGGDSGGGGGGDF